MEKSSLRAEDIMRNRTQKGIALSGDGSLGASMTVEAALVLPLFLFFIFNVLFLFDVVRLQSSVTGSANMPGTGSTQEAKPEAERACRRSREATFCPWPLWREKSAAAWAAGI